MPQTANLLGSFRGPNGTARPLADATAQGLALAIQGRVGATYFVDYDTGDDEQDRAGGAFTPFKTIGAALELAVSGDTIFLTGRQGVTETLEITQNNLAIIGLNGPSQNNRARLVAEGTVFTPMVNVTGQGCRFENISTFYGFNSATTQICWQELGGRNYYKNVQFNGGGHATAAAQAGMRSLIIGGEGENIFDRCTFGLDTVSRATNANATLEFVNSGGQGQRNVFYEPVFRMQSALAGNVHINAASGATDRAQFMFNPMFFNGVDSTATQITVDVTWAASASLMLNGVLSVGAAKVANGQAVYVAGPASNAGAGLGVQAG